MTTSLTPSGAARTAGRTPRRHALVLAGVAAALALTGCSVGVSQDDAEDPSSTPAATAPPTTSTPSSTPTPTPTPTPTETQAAPAAAGPAVPGYAYGEVPPVPLMVMPDLTLLDSSTSSFTRETATSLGTYPGVTVTAARCDDTGQVTPGTGAALGYGQGGYFRSPDGSETQYGDGSGTFTLNGVTVNNYGDGSGSYEGDGLTIWNYGDGSGSYESTDTTIWLYGDGSGSESSPRGEFFFYGDGSASFENGTTTIWNYGDGSASYDDGTLEIWNYGDGTGAVNGVATTVEPVPDAPVVGTFPALDALAPVTSCGTLITLEGSVLFDPEQFAIRPDAAAALDGVAQALVDLGAPQARVEGHTDSDRDDAYNLELSQHRADAVAGALAERGVPAEIATIGHGESRPVAPNEIDGVANPAGKQLNRRVEIFVPAF